MFQKQLSTLGLSLAILCLAGHAGATTLTSSNSLDAVGSTNGASTSVYTDWMATLTGGVLGEGSGFSALPTFTADGTFAISGYTGTASTPYGSAYNDSSSSPMVLTMPNLPAFTGLELGLVGNLSVVVTLSDGSTVTTGPLSFGSTPNFVTFTSPLQIISAEIDSATGSSLFDVSWGTANPNQLPTQPQQQGQGGGGTGGDTSAVPEVSTLWLMGGGLLGLSHLIRRRKHLLNF